MGKGDSIRMEYDLQGNRTKLTDPDAGVITSLYDGWGQLVREAQKVHIGNDSLTYDTMNRLISWNVFQGSSLQQTNSMAYDASTGNIHNKSDLGNYTFGYGANGKPHALTSISGIPVKFPSDDLEVTYTDFKKIKTLTEGDKVYNLIY